ncbi:MAG: hypothetical protein VB106_18720 [Clostridiaceae bacterium]|nr:hypothetical protein [Clostridiaceae bacterium]
MKFPDSAGLLLAIVDGFIKDETMMVQTIDNYRYPFGDFVEHLHVYDQILADLEDGIRVPRLYIIAGHKDKIKQAEQVWRTKIQQAFEQILRNEPVLEKLQRKIKKTNSYCLESFYWLYLSEMIVDNCVHYPREWKTENEDLVILSFYWTLNPVDDQFVSVEQTISFWREREQPALKGYQCLSRSFILRDVTDRKVMAVIPDRERNRGLVLEGGIFLPLADDFESGLSKLKSSHINQWTAGEVMEILLNPIYAFGYYYQHLDLICEWFYAFLYGLATVNKDRLTNVNIELLYRRFCDYIGKHICPYILIEQKIIEVDQFIKTLIETLNKIRCYLKGEEETGISQNVILMMRNRYGYLLVIHQFLQKKCGLDIVDTHIPINLDCDYWGNQLDNLRKGNSSYAKGKRLEDIAQYFIGTIPGLRVTDTRSKRGRAEVDVFCCNVSYDSYLWKLGALILIECKNRKKKVEVADIRNLVPTMKAKGIIGAIIFSAAGFSLVSVKEIKYQLFDGKMIIPISLEDLRGVGKKKGAYDLLREKIDYFESILENGDRQLYF